MRIQSIWFDKILYTINEAIHIIKFKLFLPLLRVVETLDYYKFYYARYNPNITYHKFPHPILNGIHLLCIPNQPEYTDLMGPDID